MRRPKSDPYLSKLVSVFWQDPCGYGGWHKSARLEEYRGLADCTTIGTCVKHDDDVIVVASSWNSEGDWGDITFIPKVMVTDVRFLLEVT